MSVEYCVQCIRHSVAQRSQDDNAIHRHSCRWCVTCSVRTCSCSLSQTWPPNGPDLNPCDYATWGAIQHMVDHRQNFVSVDELKRAIVEAWQKLPQSTFVTYWRPSKSIGLTVLCFYSKTGFWPSYCQSEPIWIKFLHTTIVVHNTLVGRLRPRSARGRLPAKPKRLCFL